MELSDIRKAIVIGGGHGIGLALVKRIRHLAPEAKIYATFREQDKATKLIEFANHEPLVEALNIDPTEEEDLKLLVKSSSTSPKPLQCIMVSVGLLHSGNLLPEKSLKQINPENLMEYFRVNSLVTPLVAKHFLPCLRHSKESIFAAISAKVGSIDDNRLGGWYGYRSSKAALNMYLRNIAIEFGRYGIKSRVLAIHPGTTITALSEPYLKNTKLKLHSPDEAAENIFSAIVSQSYRSEAQFLSWDGTTIRW